jgi:phosphonate transport system permease protein
MTPPMSSTQITVRQERIAALRRTRPKNVFLRCSAAAMIGLVLWAWTTGGPLLGRLSSERRWTNFQNFTSQLIPQPVRYSGSWLEAIPWAWNLLVDGGFTALLITLGIACAAIVLAALAVLPFLPLASRRLARPHPLTIWMGRTSPITAAAWRLLGTTTRFLFVLARAIPEYILAFLLISLLGLQVWPLVLALAIHNFGILGRLWSEVLENADPAAAEQSLATGSGRIRTFATTLFPAAFNRFLIYFFYRWETYTKDATVLGMLGLLTLGHLIALSKGFFWDEMFFYILLASSVIVVGDLFSTLVRRWLRR